jgi:hypothetical protein
MFNNQKGGSTQKVFVRRLELYAMITAGIKEAS